MSRPDFTKVVRFGATKEGYNVFSKISYRTNPERLSFTGVEGPTHNGDCKGSCGQIRMSFVPSNITDHAPGWNHALIVQFFQIWDRWHLNDMRAGSPAQEDYLRDHPIKAVYPQSHYVLATDKLREVGLNPDPTTGYFYGHAWLPEAVPDEVLDFLQALPDTDNQPAWV